MNSPSQLQICFDPSLDREQLRTMLDFKALEQRQTQNRFFNHGFQRFAARKSAVCRVLLTTCKRLSLKRSSFALALAILDASVSLLDFSPALIEVAARVALKMTVKVNEDAAEDLLGLFLRSQSKVQRVQEARLEAVVLNALNFKVHFVTCFHFLEVFLRFEGVRLEVPSTPVTDSFAVKDFAGLVYSLNVVVSSEYRFNQFTAVAVATAVLMIARHFCEADELLPAVVADVTGLEDSDLQPILEIVWATVEDALALPC